jgi:hypothetical protein
VIGVPGEPQPVAGGAVLGYHLQLPSTRHRLESVVVAMPPAEPGGHEVDRWRQCDASRDHGNPQGGGTNTCNTHEGPDEHQCDSDPDEGCHDNTTPGSQATV